MSDEGVIKKVRGSLESTSSSIATMGGIT